MRLNRRERGLLFTTIALVLVALSYVVFRPLIQSIEVLGQTAAGKERELAGYRATIDRVPQWQRDYDELRAGLGQQISSFQTMSDVLKKIEEVAAAAGVNITSRKPLLENDHGSYRELPVQCRVEGSTATLVQFLFRLRTGSGFVNVEKLEIFSQANSGVLRCDIVIHALAGKTERSKT